MDDINDVIKNYVIHVNLRKKDLSDFNSACRKAIEAGLLIDLEPFNLKNFYDVLRFYFNDDF